MNPRRFSSSKSSHKFWFRRVSRGREALKLLHEQDGSAMEGLHLHSRGFLPVRALGLAGDTFRERVTVDCPMQ